MKRYAVFHGYIVDARHDGDISLNAKIQAVIDKDDRGAFSAMVLVAQANLANDLLTALRDLVDFAEGFDPMRESDEDEVAEVRNARALIAKAEGRDE